ncbi:cytochrome P450 1A1-like [Actinia tenebrosa]|uniref:Cytochrome P450 1A1-like n=1 Tax=Actinia tenebrosa TaxID=6105 RepID=A0A6P8I326_ACTTE|nr:cytochrome P450 1A1-like [Actinia tenebrosa]
MDYDQYICFSYLLHPIMCTVLVALLMYLFWSKLVRLNELPEETLRDPPGPFALPIVGNISLLGSQPHLNLTHLADLYGEIYSLRLGSRKVVVLNSVKMAQEVLVKNARHFSDRPPLQSFQVNSNNGQSISFGNAGQWYCYHKRFASRALTKMYENGERFDQIASDEIMHLKYLLGLDQSNEPIDPTSLMKELVFKFSFRILFGDDLAGMFAEDFYHIVGQSATFVENNSAVNLVDFFPWLAALFKNQTRKIKLSVDQLMDSVKRIYQGHTTRGDNNIHSCITEALKGEALTEQTLSEDSMVQILADLFGAGLETVSTSMIWAVAFLASNKSLQEQLYDELKGAIGKTSNRSPSLEDKSKMPLLQAIVLEVLRMSSVLPLGLPHYCSQDAVISGYRIDKGTLVLLNLWAINHDPNSFERPNSFNPYRFLDPVTHQLVNDDWMLALPFSIGTRKCLGSTVAKSELFLLMAGLLHNFSFEMAGESADLNGTFGLTLRPRPFSVYIHKRF